MGLGTPFPAPCKGPPLMLGQWFSCSCFSFVGEYAHGLGPGFEQLENTKTHIHTVQSIASTQYL